MKLNILFAGLAVLFLAASCTAGTEGIFASVERETKIVSLGGLSKYASVTSMAELGSPVNRYFAAGGRALFSRSTASGSATWDSSSVGGSDSVLAVGVSGTKAYAVAGGTLWESTDGNTWKATPNVAATDTAYDLVPVKDVNGQTSSSLLLITTDSTKSGSRNHVYRISGGTLNATPIDLTTTLPANSTLSQAVLSAVTDGTVFYLASPSYVWSVGSSFTGQQIVTLSGVPLSGFTGLLYYGGKLYLSTASSGSTGGGLYFAPVTAGTAATSITFTTITSGAQTASGAPVSFGFGTFLHGSSFLYNDINNSLWVATGPSTTTEGTGYTEVTLPQNTYSRTPTTDSNNYTSSNLPTYVVGTLYKAADGTYFLGTVAHGLWTWNKTAKTWSQQ